MLFEGLDGQIVVVQAPAGYGKTELLSAAYCALRADETGVAQRLGITHSCWVSLSAAHADSGVFIRDLTDTLCIDGAFDTVESLLQALGSRPGNTALFIDDADLPASEALRAHLDSLFRGAPENLRIVCALRNRPRMPLARFRVRGLVTEIAARHLAFNPAEIRAVLGDGVAEQDLAAIAGVTQGWPALVRLAGELYCDGDAADRAEVAKGAHAVLFEYVDQVVLADIPHAAREVFEASAIVDEFSLELAAQLSGTSIDAQTRRLLDDLSPAVVKSHRGADWYLFHPIVRASLENGLSMRMAGAPTALHARAAAWFARHGLLERAVAHAARAGDYALGAEAVRSAGGVELFLSAGYSVLVRLIEDFPEEVIRSSPALTLCQALVFAKRGHFAAAHENLALLRREDNAPIERFGPIPVDSFAHIEGMVEIYEDRFPDPDLASRLERRAAALASSAHFEAGWIHNHLSIIYFRCGEIDLAHKSALKGLRCYRDERSDYGTIFQHIHLALINTVMGNLTAAFSYCQEADSLIQATQWTDRNLIAIAAVAKAEVLYLRGEVEGASQLLGDAVEPLSEGESWVDLYSRLFTILARSRYLLSGFDEANRAIDRAEEIAVERSLPRLRVVADTLRAEMLVRSGRFESADRMIESLSASRIVDRGETSWAWREECDLLLVGAQVKLAQRQHLSALADIERARLRASEAGSGYHGLKCAILACIASWSLGEHDMALAHLQSAIAAGRAHGTIQPFLDEGAPLQAVIRSIVRRFGLSSFSPDAVGFLGSIAGLAARRGPTRGSESSRRRGAGPHAQLFSQREWEVLVQLQRGSSNKEIARELALAETTVKFHLKNIFSKLGVSRRGLAVVVAKRIAAQ